MSELINNQGLTNNQLILEQLLRKQQLKILDSQARDDSPLKEGAKDIFRAAGYGAETLSNMLRLTAIESGKLVMNSLVSATIDTNSAIDDYRMQCIASNARNRLALQPEGGAE